MRLTFILSLGFSVYAYSEARAQGPQIGSVELRPSALTVHAGESARFEAVARDSAGLVVRDQPTAWFATPFDIAGTDSTGVVTTTRPGRTFVYAIVGGKVGVARLDILEREAAGLSIEGDDTVVVGSAVPFAVQGYTSLGDPVPLASVTWSATPSNIAAAIPGGLIRGLRPGIAQVMARSGDLRATRRLVVRPSPATGLALHGPARARVGEVVSLGVEARGAPGRALSTAGVRLAVVGGGATVAPDGRFVAERPGHYLITASLGSLTAVGMIEVTPRQEHRRVEQVAVARLPRGVQGGELWVKGDALYLSTISNRIYVYDVSRPAMPRLTDSMVVDARLINDVTTTADGKVGVFPREGASNRKNGLTFFDASDPLHPRIIGEYTTGLEGGVHSAFVDGHYVYATHDPTGSLRIIDFQDPRHPREIGRYEIPRQEVASYDVEFLTLSPQRFLHDVMVKDGLAYLAYWRDGLIILDVGKGIKGGSAEHPVLVGRYRYNHATLYPPGFIAGTHAVFVDGDYAFIGDESYPGNADLESAELFPTRGIMQVIDVRDPEHPVKVAEYDPVEFGVHNLWVAEGLLYIGGYNGGLRVLDITGELRGDLRAQGRVIGSLYTGALDGFRPNMALTRSAIPHGGYVFASDINTGLWVARVVGAATP